MREVLLAYHRGYRELLVNLSGIVLRKMLCSMMAGVQADNI